MGSLSGTKDYGSGWPARALNCVLLDITEQKRLSNELLSLYNNIPGAVFRSKFDDGFTVIEANDGFYDLTGYTREEFAAGL